jgi:hypothetical protein
MKAKLNAKSAFLVVLFYLVFSTVVALIAAIFLEGTIHPKAIGLSMA